MSAHISNAEEYSKNNNLQFSFAMQVLAKSNIDKNAVVLDIGCRDGRITFEISKLTTSVIGIDISNNMIEQAKKTYQQQENLNFLQVNTLTNKFKNKFDVITSFNYLHWVLDQENALKEIASVAAEDAKIILLLSHKKSYYHFALDVITTNPKWSFCFKDYVNPRSFFECDQYKNLLKKAQLHVVSLTEKEMTYYFNSIEQLKDFFRSSMAHIKQIPDDKKDEFLDDYGKEFLKQIECKDFSRIPVSYWCLEIFAKKDSNYS